MTRRTFPPANAGKATEDSELSEARREAIIDAASEVFLRMGYASASISTIAARVGISKVTIYKCFSSKEELFEAYVRRRCVLEPSEMQSVLAVDGDAREVLSTWAVKFLRFVTSDRSLANWRVVSTGNRKQLEFGRILYESGPLVSIAMLSDYLQKRVAAGEFAIANTVEAAHQFVSLVHGRLMEARLLQYAPAPDDEQIRAEVETAVATFFAAFQSGASRAA